MTLNSIPIKEDREMPDVTNTHEYRISIVVPLSGSDREQSKAKAQIAPLLDKLEEDIRALGLTVAVEDNTVKLGRGKNGKAAAAGQPAADAG